MAMHRVPLLLFQMLEKGSGDPVDSTGEISSGTSRDATISHGKKTIDRFGRHHSLDARCHSLSAIARREKEKFTRP